MALEIRPANPASSTSESTKTSRTRGSGTDLFSIDLGAKKAAPPPPAAPPKKTPPARTPSAANKSAAQQPAAQQPAGRQPVEKRAAGDNSHSDEQKSDAPEEASADASSPPAATAKTRTTATTPTPPKNPPAPAQMKSAVQEVEQTAGNASGMSLLQTLTKSLEGGDSDTTLESDASSTVSDTTDISGDKNASQAEADANAKALALFTQALAVALGATAAANPQAPANKPVAAADGATRGIADATSKPSNGQNLVTLLTQMRVADGKLIESDTSRSSSASADSPVAQQSVDVGASTPATAGNPGVASHFSLQHPTAVGNAPSTTTAVLKSAVGSPAWNDELGGQLTWMSQKGLESGSLRVSPDHLGPVEVQITVHKGEATVWFGASHPDTRTALEQAMPRLREMFATQGMTLTDSGVSRESPRNQARETSKAGVGAVTAVGTAEVSAPAGVRASLGLVDTYA